MHRALPEPWRLAHVGPKRGEERGVTEHRPRRCAGQMPVMSLHPVLWPHGQRGGKGGSEESSTAQGHIAKECQAGVQGGSAGSQLLSTSLCGGPWGRHVAVVACLRCPGSVLPHTRHTIIKRGSTASLLQMRKPRLGEDKSFIQGHRASGGPAWSPGLLPPDPTHAILLPACLTPSFSCSPGGVHDPLGHTSSSLTHRHVPGESSLRVELAAKRDKTPGHKGMT